MEEDDLWERFVAWENLAAAAREARRRKRSRPDVVAFERRREENLAELREELLSGTYRPGPYRRFSIYDPKPRRRTQTAKILFLRPEDEPCILATWRPL